MLPFYAYYNAQSNVSSGDLTLSFSSFSNWLFEGDLMLLTVESDDTAMSCSGWTEAPDSPISNGNTRLTVFYKRYAPGDSGPTVSGTGHKVGVLTFYRGIKESGDPFDVTSTSTGTGTSISISGDTTTTDECLVVMAVSTARNANSFDNFTSISNGSLSDFAEMVDYCSSVGGGIGLSIGGLATAGTYGSTTMDQAASEDWAGWTCALLPAATQRPYFRGDLGQAMSANSGTVSILQDINQPTGAAIAGDVVIFAAETNNEAFSVTGFTEAAHSPQSNGSTRLTVFWKRLDGSETSIAFGDSGDHQYTSRFVIRGCIPTGSPFDTTSGTTGGNGTSVSIPGSSTTVDNCLVIAMAGTSLDQTTGGNFTSWANSDLDLFQEVWDETRLLNAGGGVSFAVGVKTAAGSYGATTATQTIADDWTGWTGALKAVEGGGNRGEGFFGSL